MKKTRTKHHLGLTLMVLTGLLCPQFALSGTDTDGDGLNDDIDNCPLISNPLQIDSDFDDHGDVCDTDDDNDGLLDSEEDNNENGTIDPGETDPLDFDSDNDNYDDGMEITHGSDPLNIASIPAHGNPTMNACLADAAEARTADVIAVSVPLSLQQKSYSLSAFEDDRFVITQGTDLFSYHPETLVPIQNGSLLDTASAVSPVVKLNDSFKYLFQTALDGKVRKVTDGLISIEGAGTSWPVDTSRGAFGDSINATAKVHLWQHASLAYQAQYPQKDLIYVGTDYTSSTANRVYFIDGESGAVVNTFNFNANFEMSPVSGLTLDVSSDLLFVATNFIGNPEQHSLWVINVLNGLIAWSVGVGDLVGSPLLAGDKVYSVSVSGEINAFDQTSGAFIWSLPASNPVVPILDQAKITITPTGDVLIAKVDFFGGVTMVRDDGTSGTELWHLTDLPSGVEASSTALEFGLGGENLFVGGKNGRIYQLDVATGAIEASRLASATKAVKYLAIQQDNPFDNREPSLFVATENGKVYRFCQPFRTNTVEIDTDEDGITDGADNCPNNANAIQNDVDQDGLGDACDPLNQYFLSISGTLNGLTSGNSVTLQNNDGDDLVLSENGIFTFSEFLIDAPLPYDITVIAQPITPAQNCIINNSNGTLDGLDIINIEVNCSPSPLDLIFVTGFE